MPFNMIAKDQDMRCSHQHDLNFEFPHLNFNGMLWFRDDDVLIGNSLHSILTVYQPLYDPRDFNDIKLCFDIEDPVLVRLHHPNVPTYMHKDLESMHNQELKTDPKNSELFSFTAKKHKKAAIKLANSDKHRIQITECHLPFSVTSEQFGNIDNTGGEAEKHYRKIEVKVTDRIKDTCSYIFWKILIEGETTHLKSKRRAIRNQFDEAEERLNESSIPYVGDVNNEADDEVDEEDVNMEEDDDDAWTEEELDEEEEEVVFEVEEKEEQVAEEDEFFDIEEEEWEEEEIVHDKQQQSSLLKLSHPVLSDHVRRVEEIQQDTYDHAIGPVEQKEVTKRRPDSNDNPESPKRSKIFHRMDDEEEDL